MLYFERIYLSEGTDVNETSESKESDICRYCYFLDKGFNFQPNVCNEYHDLLIMFMNLSDAAILTLRPRNTYIYIFGALFDFYNFKPLPVGFRSQE